MPYTGTDSLSSLVFALPSGSGLPSELDDAIREAKKVLTTVLQNHLTDKGALRKAYWKYNTSTSVATSANTVWYRLPMGSLSDNTNLLTGGTYANSIKPIAGTYLVTFMVSGYSCGRFQGRLAEATSSVQNPSGSNVIADLVSGQGASNATNPSVAHAFGKGYLVADGIKSYCLDFINDSAGNVALSAGTNGLTGPTAWIEFEYLGAVLP